MSEGGDGCGCSTGCGCLMMALAVIMLFNMGRVLDIIQNWLMK